MKKGALVRRILLSVLGLVLLAGGYLVMKIGPRNVLGMLLYDQRREGDLKVGDQAPDGVLRALDGEATVRLADRIGTKPLVLVFGSFT